MFICDFLVTCTIFVNQDFSVIVLYLSPSNRDFSVTDIVYMTEKSHRLNFSICTFEFQQVAYIVYERPQTFLKKLTNRIQKNSFDKDRMLKVPKQITSFPFLLTLYSNTYFSLIQYTILIIPPEIKVSFQYILK